MGFFATFWTWLNAQLSTYIGSNTERLAEALEPAIVTLATIYVMAWGYLQLCGRIEEPLIAGLKRIALLAIILGAGLHLWLYNSLIVDTFYSAPSQLAAAVVGSGDPVGTIDAIWNQGGAVAGALWTRGGPIDFSSKAAGVIVWLLIGTVCVYAMFLIALSNISLAILLALGPLFIAGLFFDYTRRFFSAWLAQLANYAFITILTVMIAALLLQLVSSYAAQTAALGANVLTVDVLNMLLMAVLVFLLMRQVMPIAAGLAGGVALSSFGAVSSSLSRAMGATSTAAGAARKHLNEAGGREWRFALRQPAGPSRFAIVAGVPMRFMCCLLLLLCGCVSHSVRCDGRLSPINGVASPPADPESTRTPRVDR